MYHGLSRQTLQAFDHAGVGGTVVGSQVPGTPTETALLHHLLTRRVGLDEARLRVAAMRAGFPPPPARVAHGAFHSGWRTRPRWRHLLA